MIINKKSVSPLISVILIIVVSVILVTIILSVTKNQAQQALSVTDSFGEQRASDIHNFIYVQNFDFDNQFIDFRYTPDKSQINTNTIINKFSVIGVDESNLFYNLPIVRSITPYTIKEGINRLPLPGINLYHFPANDFKIQLYTTNGKYIILSPKLNNKKDFVNLSDVILYHDYSLFENGDLQITDISENGNAGTPTDIIKSNFGIEFASNSAQILIPADPSLDFGNSDFSIEFFIDKNYAGHILSQRKETTSIAQSIYVTDNGFINFNFNNASFDLAPYAVAVDDEYIYYTTLNCIYKLKKNYSSEIKTCDLGNSIDNPTTISYAYALAVDDDYLYVSNGSRHRIIKLNKSDLTYVNHIGGPTAGDENYKFNSPIGLFLIDDLLYVADTINKKIKTYTTDLIFVNSINSVDYIAGEAFTQPHAIVVDSENIFVASFDSVTRNQIYKYTKTAPHNFVDVLSFDPIYTEKNMQGRIYGLTIDSDYIYFTGQNDGGIYKYTKNFDFVLRQGFWGYSTNNQFYPYGITIDGDNLYVSDRTGARIVKRNKTDLSYINHFGYFGVNSENYVPRKIAADDEHIYLADCGNSRIVKANQIDFSIVDSVGGPTHGNCVNCLSNPCAGITVYDSNLYVMDLMNQRIVIKDKSNLSHISDFNSYFYDGSFYDIILSYDIEIAVDADYIYLANLGEYALLKINKNTLSAEYALNEISGFGAIAPSAVTIDDQYLFISSGTNLLKLNKSDLSLINSVNTGASIFSLSNDSEYIYLGNRTVGNYGLVKRRKTDLVSVLTTSKGIMNRLPKTVNNIGDITGIAYANGFIFSVSWFDGAFYRYSVEDFKFRDFKGSIELMQIRSNTSLIEDTHVIITRNKNQICVYLNSVEDNCKNIDYDLNISFNYPLLVGNMQTGDLIFNRDKKMYFLRFYKTGLTENQIKSLYLLETENRFD